MKRHPALREWRRKRVVALLAPGGDGFFRALVTSCYLQVYGGDC